MKKTPVSNSRRRGVVSVVVLIVLMLITGLVAQYARRAISERRQMRTEFHHQQAIELAQAGVLRLQQRLGQDADFEAETWEVPAGTVHQTNTGTVRISIKDKQASVVARYPTNHDHPIQVTRRILLDD